MTQPGKMYGIRRVAGSCSSRVDFTPPQKIDRAVCENEPEQVGSVPCSTSPRACWRPYTTQTLSRSHKEPLSVCCGRGYSRGWWAALIEAHVRPRGHFYSPEAPRMRSARQAQRSRQKVRKRAWASPARTRKARSNHFSSPTPSPCPRSSKASPTPTTFLTVSLRLRAVRARFCATLRVIEPRLRHLREA